MIMLSWLIILFVHRFELKALYMYAGGFYTYSIFALVFWETRRSDFGVSMGHHIVTVFLIVLSYILRYVSKGFNFKFVYHFLCFKSIDTDYLSQKIKTTQQ